MEVDFIELSGGTYEELRFNVVDIVPRESTKKREAYFTEVQSLNCRTMTSLLRGLGLVCEHNNPRIDQDGLIRNRRLPFIGRDG